MRWSTALADKFMLPHFVGPNFLDVLGDLNRAGYELTRSGTMAQREFASRSMARSKIPALRLELRQASLEPWHVLGEEGASRRHRALCGFLVERLQVKVDGFVQERHVVTATAGACR